MKVFRKWWLALWLVLLTASASCLEITVDPVSGTDSLCSSVDSNNITHSCKTLNRALGNSRDCECINVTSSGLDNVVIKLANGIHTIGDCIAINYGQNVTIEAENSGEE